MQLKRKTRIGEVTSNKMKKTIVVKIERVVTENVFKKIVRYYSKVKVHDEDNICKIGDQVKIIETRPLSKEKRWRVLEVIGNVKHKPTEGEIV